MRDWNEDDMEDDEYFDDDKQNLNVIELENKIKKEDKISQRDMLDEIQDDTLAFL
jgi:hypothetical protein